MTEKRFVVEKYSVRDMSIDEKYVNSSYHIGDKSIAQSLCDLLNEQHETILSLHKTIEELDNCQKGQSHRINDLYLENKQLKDLITHLGYTIKYDGYRHISLELKR